MTEKTLADLISEQLPYDGPHYSEKAVAAASSLSALVRYLNNATFPGRSTLAWAATVYRLLGPIGDAVSGLDQLFRQLAMAMDLQAADPTLYDARRDPQHPASETAAMVAVQLDVARVYTADLAGAVRRAQETAAHLGNDY